MLPNGLPGASANMEQPQHIPQNCLALQQISMTLQAKRWKQKHPEPAISVSKTLHIKKPVSGAHIS